MTDLTENLNLYLYDASCELTPDPSLLTLIYCIEGSVRVDEHQTYTAGSFLLLERGIHHSIQCLEKSLYARILFDYYALCAYNKSSSVLFFCDSMLESGSKYSKCREKITRLIRTYALSGPSLVFLSDALLLQNDLMEHFSLHLNEKDPKTLSRSERLKQIQDYIYVNSHEKISLEALSTHFYVSPSVLSRMFSEMTGESFVSYVKKVRLSKISRELIQTDKSITRLAADHGFSNASAMSGAFRKHFGLLPSEYRKKHQPAEDGNASQKKLMQQLRKTLSTKEKMNTQSPAIHVGFNTNQPQKKWTDRIVNIGPARHLMNARIQEHILHLKKNLKIEYIRIWNLFSEDLLMQNKDLQKVSFLRLDTIFDFCAANDIRLFIDFGQRTDLIMADSRTKLYYHTDLMEFTSPGDWSFFLTRFIRHLVHRYGKTVISEWIFEFGMFLTQNPYYVSENYSAVSAWDLSCSVIRNEIPQARIAGPGLISSEDSDFLRKVLSSFFSAEHKPDIFTTVLFPYLSPDQRQQPQALSTIRHIKLLNDPQFLQRRIEQITVLLSEFGFTGQHVVVEWNFSISNRNYLQDSCFRAAYLTDNLLRTLPLCQTMALWYATDLINVSYDSVRVLSGSAGLLSVDGIRKPAFYAYAFLDELGRFRLYQDERVLVTADSSEHYHVLCCFGRSLGIKYYLNENEDYSPAELESLFNHESPLSLKITIEGLREGDTYLIRSRILNRDHGSVLGRWMSLSCSDTLSFEDIGYLRQISVPEITMEKQIVENGKIHLSLNLLPDEVRSVSIIRI